MSKIIVSKVSKLLGDEVKESYGATADLAVILPNEDGKLSIITPRVSGDEGQAKLVLSKKDLKELSKLLKDNEDCDSVELEILISNS